MTHRGETLIQIWPWSVNGLSSMVCDLVMMRTMISKIELLVSLLNNIKCLSEQFLNYLFFSECTLLFSKEKGTQSLRIFNRSSSIKLNTIPREDCFVTGTAYVIASNGTVAWKQFKAANSPFLIHHEDRNKDKHDHFLQVC